VRQDLRLLLLWHQQDDIYQALRNQRGEVRSVGAAGGDSLFNHVDNRTVQALVGILFRCRPFTFGHRFHLRLPD
jgi:hypothetical protein